MSGPMGFLKPFYRPISGSIKERWFKLALPVPCNSKTQWCFPWRNK